MDKDKRIEELEDKLRQIKLGDLNARAAKKSYLGNIYFPNNQTAVCRPYEGNDNCYLMIFKDDRYRAFLDQHPDLQTYWRAPMYLVERQTDGYKLVCTNIQQGDYFGCGTHKQIGIVYRKLTAIQASIAKENRMPSPGNDDAKNGNYIKYYIGGDIGGHDTMPDHDRFTTSEHFMWLPTPSRLLFSGYHGLASDLMHLMVDISKDVYL